MAADSDDPRRDELGQRRDRGDLSGGPRELPSGGYQRPGAEGGRAYAPGERGGGGTLPERGLAEGSAEEIAAPFDEDAILDRVDRERHGSAAGTGGAGAAHGRTLPSGAGADASTTSDSGVTGMTAGTGASGGGDPLLGAEEIRGKRRALAPVDKTRSENG
jgi:hypothetical protein